MTKIEVSATGPDHFGVQVTEGDTTSSHRVHLPRSLLDEQQLTEVDPELVVRESFEFLLEREPPTSILSEFSLDEIPRYFPEYFGELRRRLGTG
jgi:hypothetical protein